MAMVQYNLLNMGYFAKLNENNVVIGVHSVSNFVFETDGIDDEQNGIDYLTSIYNHPHWKQTSYNTRGGIHYINGDSSSDQSKAFRKNYAGVNYVYDERRDAFIPPNPYPSWTLDEFSCLWQPPIANPNKDFIPIEYKNYNIYKWNEDVMDWKLIKPFRSWLPTGTPMRYYYSSPVPCPNDGASYRWDEDILNWNLID